MTILAHQNAGEKVLVDRAANQLSNYHFFFQVGQSTQLGLERQVRKRGLEMQISGRRGAVLNFGNLAL